MHTATAAVTGPWDDLGMRLDPAAQLFPDLSAAQYAALKADIHQHGVREPIWVTRAGALLDGRHRKRACQELGIPCPQKIFHGADPIAFVASLNLHRRHLTARERAEVAAKITTLRHGGIRPGSGLARFKTPNGVLNKPAKKREVAGAVTIQKAARLMRVGTMSVSRAKQRLGLSQPKTKRVTATGTPQAKPTPSAKQTTPYGRILFSLDQGVQVEGAPMKSLKDLERELRQMIATFRADWWPREKGLRFVDILTDIASNAEHYTPGEWSNPKYR